MRVQMRTFKTSTTKGEKEGSTYPWERGYKSRSRGRNIRGDEHANPIWWITSLKGNYHLILRGRNLHFYSERKDLTIKSIIQSNVLGFLSHDGRGNQYVLVPRKTQQQKEVTTTVIILKRMIVIPKSHIYMLTQTLFQTFPYKSLLIATAKWRKR